MEKIKIRIINHSTNPLPSYATPGAAGLDLQAYLEENINIKPMERRLISTGMHIELPEGYEAQIRPRSGMALKQGITVLNTPGTIDADYRGEIKIILVNLSEETVTIENGQRIAQMVVAAYQPIQWEDAEALSDTQRGHGGYGHTGR